MVPYKHSALCCKNLHNLEMGTTEFCTAICWHNWVSTRHWWYYWFWQQLPGNRPYWTKWGPLHRSKSTPKWCTMPHWSTKVTKFALIHFIQLSFGEYTVWRQDRHILRTCHWNCLLIAFWEYVIEIFCRLSWMLYMQATCSIVWGTRLHYRYMLFATMVHVGYLLVETCFLGSKLALRHNRWYVIIGYIDSFW